MGLEAWKLAWLQAHGLETLWDRHGVHVQGLEVHQGRQEMLAKSALRRKLCIALNKCIRMEERKSIISVSKAKLKEQSTEKK